MVAETWGNTVKVSRKADPRDWIRAAAEAQQGRVMLWAPVALTIGIWSYFGLASEPSWIFLAPFAAAGALLFWMSRTRRPLALAALAIAGCVLAKAKVDFVAAPVFMPPRRHGCSAEPWKTVPPAAAGGK
ncbi:MAG: hypothetical protein ACREDN_02605 [Aestuariivirga sp.]